MSSHIFTLLLFLCLPLHGARRAPHFQNALELAKTSNADIVILLHGSDWCPRGELFKKATWDTQPFANSLGDNFILLAIDRPEKPARNQKDLDAKNAAAHANSHHFPALIIHDPEGRPYARLDQLPESFTNEQLLTTLTSHRTNRLERDRLWTEAQKATGPEKATLLGKGLTAIKAPTHGPWAPILAEMKKADPDDKSGWQLKLTYNPATPFNEALNLTRQKKYQDALALLDKELAQTHLTNDHKLHLLAGRFSVFRHWPDHLDEMKETITTMESIDPEHDWTIGARGMLLFLHGPPSYAHGWQPRHCSKEATEWIIEIDKRHLRHDHDTWKLLLTSHGHQPLHFEKITVLSGESIIHQSKSPHTLASKGNHPITLKLTPAHRQNKLTLKLTAKAPGDPNCHGKFTLTPHFPL